MEDFAQQAADAANERSKLAEEFWRALEAYQKADKKYKELRDKLMAEKQKP